MTPNEHESEPREPVVVHQIADHEHRLVAATIEHPLGWRAESGVSWNYRHLGLPVTLFCRVWHPERSVVLEIFPVEWFCWIDPFLGLQRPGQDLGDGTFLLQPAPAADVLTRWVLPKYRSTRRQARMLAVEPAPQMARFAGAANLAGASLEGACAKIAYEENGGPMVEEFYGLRAQFAGIPTYGAAGCLTQYNWGLARLFSLRAHPAEFEAERATLWGILDSVRANPEWEQLCARVLGQLKQQFDQYIAAGYAQIEAATQMSRQISAQNQAWLDGQQQRREASARSDAARGAREQSGAGDDYTANDAFGDYVMGRESYVDPYYEYGSQHSGYNRYVWTDKQGNYQYSNDANFDPNPGASASWVLLEKKQIDSR